MYVQAEYVRIPFADTSLYHVPATANQEASVMLSDLQPTGYERGVLHGEVKPGDVVAIVGSGKCTYSAQQSLCHQTSPNALSCR
jgi:threonine dehydrogenase-like Zn-dependent dehydrogenase